MLVSIDLPVLIVGNDLRIRRFTQKTEKIFKIISSDVGRLITDIKPRLMAPHLEGLILDVIKNLGMKEQEVQDEDGHWHYLQVRPYRTSDNRIDGVVITLTDIDLLKKNDRLLTTYAVYESINNPLLVLNSALYIQMANRSFYETFRVSPWVTENKSFFSLGNGQWDIPALRSLLGTILPKKNSV